MSRVAENLHLEYFQYRADTLVPVGTADHRVFPDQNMFQNVYAVGRVLNVGCDSDGAGLGMRPGAVNVDLHRVSQITGNINPVHVLADGRALPVAPVFDSVVLGEILEHMGDEDAVKLLVEAKKALKPGPQSRVVVTIPHDTRAREDQGYGELRYFAPGIPVHHPRYVSKQLLYKWVTTAMLRLAVEARIDYPWGQSGTGLVLIPMTGGRA